jgi:hypothetical protein
MRKGSHKTRVLLSFVGTNDAGRLKGSTDGAILTVFKKRKFDEVHLLWNPSKNRDVNFLQIAEYVRDEIVNRAYCDSVSLHRFDCNDVTDHNEIYPKLLDMCKSLHRTGAKKFTSAIASGTPAMQVCWILIAESGDFPLELVRSNEPRFGKPPVTSVKLSTGLPRILRLEKENETLREEKKTLMPMLEIDIRKGRIQIGQIKIDLSPVEFAYYRYFAERAQLGEELERVSGIFAPRGFLRKIAAYHKESFPASDLFRAELESMLKSGKELDIRTFRANLSKTNKKLRSALPTEAWVKLFSIVAEGKRHALSYGLRLPRSKIKIRT